MFTLALVRFPPTATKEIQYLNAKGALTYTDIAGDPVLYGNLPPREISMKELFRSGAPSKQSKTAYRQSYRYPPSDVSPASHLLAGFPFIQAPPPGASQARRLVRYRPSGRRPSDRLELDPIPGDGFRVRLHAAAPVSARVDASIAIATDRRPVDSSPIRVGIVGATGYVGAELIRLLSGHPHVSIVGLQGRDRHGDPIGGTHAHLAATGLAVESELPPVDAVFLALPHGAAAGIVPGIAANGNAVIDLGP